MKQSFTLLVTLLFTITNFAQQGINYKAVIKDNNGNVVANDVINVKFSIIAETGSTVVYAENHTNKMTDANGIIILNIGEGTPVTNTFASIAWGSDTHSLKTEIDIEQDATYEFMSTMQFKTVPYALNAANVSGLEAIDEGNGIGWRLKGFDPNNYGNIGLHAIDLSNASTASSFYGAKAPYSLATGFDTKALNDYSTAIGANTTANGFVSTAMGSYTTASGGSSTAMGANTTASGPYSTTMGFVTTASSESSTAMGNSTMASGLYSTAMGLITKAQGNSSVAIGTGTIASGQNSIAAGSYNIDDINGLLMIGNGIDDGNRNNALSLFYNNSFVIGSYQLNNNPSISTDDTRFFFNKPKGAFRAGFANGTQWDDSQIGDYSTAFGFVTTASGARSTALGSGTKASGFATTAIGNYNAEVSDAYFIIGNGIGDTDRKNAMVVKSNGNFIVGSSQLDDDNTTTDDNARLFFNKAKGAFRAGLVDDTYWDDSEVGSYSVSMGLNTKAKGQNSFAMGGNSNAIGKDAVAMGNNANATALNAISLGSQTNASNISSVALGAGTNATGVYSTAMNLTTNANAMASTAMGRHNIGTGNTNSWIETDPLFEIGNGTDDANRSNALTVLKNGTITAPSFDLAEITDDKALVTKEYLDANSATGLEKLTEETAPGSGVFRTGWRLKGVNPEFYDPIGENAVDLSDSMFTLFGFGAAGEGSVAFGRSTTATGGISTAMGLVTTASGHSSTSMGHETNAAGLTSTAMGRNTNAIGDYSTSMGFVTTASGVNSTALGNSTSALGLNSTSMGLSTIAIANASTAIGKYNTADINGLFMVGNGTGTSTANRKNAFIIKEDGKIGVNTSNPASLFEVAHGNTAPTSSNRTDAFSIRNLSNARSWQFYTASDGYLLLFNDGNYRGSFNATSGAYVQTSDRRLKKDITPLDNGTLQKVMQLNPVSYLMKEQTDTNINLGLISQEVQELFPSITHYSKEQDILTLSYTELIPILIKALQEQQEIIDGQNSKIENQNSKINTFESAMSELTKRINALEVVNNQ